MYIYTYVRVSVRYQRQTSTYSTFFVLRRVEESLPICLIKQRKVQTRFISVQLETHLLVIQLLNNNFYLVVFLSFLKGVFLSLFNYVIPYVMSKTQKASVSLEMRCCEIN